MNLPSWLMNTTLLDYTPLAGGLNSPRQDMQTRAYLIHLSSSIVRPPTLVESFWVMKCVSKMCEFAYLVFGLNSPGMGGINQGWRYDKHKII